MKDAVMMPRNVPAVSDGSTPINVASDKRGVATPCANAGDAKHTITKHNATAALNSARAWGGGVRVDKIDTWITGSCLNNPLFIAGKT